MFSLIVRTPVNCDVFSIDKKADAAVRRSRHHYTRKLAPILRTARESVPPFLKNSLGEIYTNCVKSIFRVAVSRKNTTTYLHALRVQVTRLNNSIRVICNPLHNNWWHGSSSPHNREILRTSQPLLLRRFVETTAVPKRSIRFFEWSYGAAPSLVVARLLRTPAICSLSALQEKIFYLGKRLWKDRH